MRQRAGPGGGESRLRFNKGAYDDLVFDLIRHGDVIDEESGIRGMDEHAGEHVLKDGKRITTLECTEFDGADAGKVDTSKPKAKQEEEFSDLP